jgi:DNA-binding NtrC family response regulator
MTFKVDNEPVAVLVVEDEVLLRLVTADILEDAGFHVIEAHDAQEARILLEERPDVQVVFTDWNMPGEIDGLGLAHLVSKRWPEIGIIVTSGKMHPAPGDIPAGVGFLAKPYLPWALIKEIETLILGSAEVPQGAAVLPKGIMAHSPMMAEIGGMGIAAAQREPDKS